MDTRIRVQGSLSKTRRAEMTVKMSEVMKSYLANGVVTCHGGFQLEYPARSCLLEDWLTLTQNAAT